MPTAKRKGIDILDLPDEALRMIFTAHCQQLKLILVRDESGHTKLRHSPADLLLTCRKIKTLALNLCHKELPTHLDCACVPQGIHGEDLVKI
jgi:hypothetical protein